MKNTQLDFLEPHEQAELQAILRSRKRREWWAASVAKVKGILTVGPLAWYWKAFPWTCLMQVFIAGAIAFSAPHPLPTIATTFCVMQAIILGITSGAWLMVESDKY